MSDVEVLQVMHSVMKELGFDNFLIRFNTRKILNGLADVIGCGEKIKLVFRVIDKLDKLGLDGVATELKKKPENALDDSTLGLSDEQVEKVISFLKIKSGDSSQTLSELKNFFVGVGGVAEKGLAELDFIINSLRELGISEKKWVLDPSIARGLDYYTGPVFETILTDRPDLGSVFSGGRFDGLTNRFMADSNIPAVGASVGLSRLMVAMKDAGLLPEKNSVTDVLVTVFSPELIVDSAKIAANLRKEGFKTELYFGNDSSLRAQFSYAAKKSIPFTVVIGPDEIKDGKIQLKDMTLRTQEIISLADCVLKLKGLLGK
jgi:histidyl-tRNA synthetase